MYMRYIFLKSVPCDLVINRIVWTSDFLKKAPDPTIDESYTFIPTCYFFLPA